MTGRAGKPWRPWLTMVKGGSEGLFSFSSISCPTLQFYLDFRICQFFFFRICQVFFCRNPVSNWNPFSVDIIGPLGNVPRRILCRTLQLHLWVHPLLPHESQRGLPKNRWRNRFLQYLQIIEDVFHLEFQPLRKKTQCSCGWGRSLCRPSVRNLPPWLYQRIVR